MRTYHYAPFVKVYAAVVGKGGKISAYYDLSEDVTSCKVTRNSGASSTATVTLLNKGGKYNEVFTPFDLMTVMSVKRSETTRLFTGYMTDVTRWSLYERNFNITAKDCIHRLERLYFDPHLPALRDLMAYEYSGTELWGGHGGEMYKLLNSVGGMAPRNIVIGDMPDGAMTWARQMYMAQKSDYEQSEQIAKEMFDAIMASSATITSDGQSLIDSDSAGGVTGTIGLSSMSARQKKLVEQSYKRPFRGYGLCAAWVWNVFNDAGLGGPSWGCAKDYYNKYCDYSDKSQLLPGMIIAVPTSGATGSAFGHIGIYVGDGKVRHNGAGPDVSEHTLDDWISLYTAHGTYAVGWGWYNGDDLTK